ncbi:hypothetical protein G9A89_007844 [Geosiphon pyriformis]|nr:hypothetical protein G9A89_007844 [Geosiphon pyriformis]
MAFAPPVISEFPSLMAFVPFVTVVDSAVGFRLDSLEKQILDLAALVKSIVESIGSLVVLVSHLLDNNAVKTVQLEKDLFSMKYASNNFTNLLAAKPSLLSENTVKYVIALWQMLSAEVRSSIESTKLFLSEFIFDFRNLNSIIEKIHRLELFPSFIVSA